MVNHVLYSSDTLNLIHLDWLEPVYAVGYEPQKYQFLSNSFSVITQSPEITFCDNPMVENVCFVNL